MSKISLVWFRRDLRLHSNQAVLHAVQGNDPVCFIYVLDENRMPVKGRAQSWWLYHSLTMLSADLAKRGHKLVLLCGDSVEVISGIVREYDQMTLCINRTYHPAMDLADTELDNLWQETPHSISSFCDRLVKPGEIRSLKGDAYKVFTPYYKAASDFISANFFQKLPNVFPNPEYLTQGSLLEKLELLPENPNWAIGFAEGCQPGEKGARLRAIDFIKTQCSSYNSGRDYPSKNLVSRLSAHLHFGEISAQMLVNALLSQTEMSVDSYIRQLVWREFSLELLLQFPDLPIKAFKSGYDQIAWRNDPLELSAWKVGRTGYPIIDAGMRELRCTGFMHNRVRMIAASFLVKNLLIDWRYGLQWFEENLLDADLANNAASWQWVVGSGADAAPYFRIFNPITQSKKFDESGNYIRKWVPELSAIPNQFIHEPWTTPKEMQKSSRVNIGEGYPSPIVDLAFTRKAALAEYKRALT